MYNTKGLTVVRFALSCLSLIATFLFLISIGSGFGALLFAVSGTLTQAATIVYLPPLAIDGWHNDNLILTGISGAMLVVVVLVSVTGSTSILSGLVDEQMSITNQKKALSDLVQSKQESAQRLISLDRITSAQPLLKEVAELQEQIAALPKESGFYLAASRVAGANAETLITVIIVSMSLLLDAVTLLLGTLSGIQREQVQVIESQPYQHEIIEVRSAMTAGKLDSPSVRNVRALLGCSQRKALEISRMVREVQDALV